jgi:hypothetical protein
MDKLHERKDKPWRGSAERTCQELWWSATMLATQPSPKLASNKLDGSHPVYRPKRSKKFHWAERICIASNAE